MKKLERQIKSRLTIFSFTILFKWSLLDGAGKSITMMLLDTQLAQLHEMMPSSSTLPPCIVFSVASGLPAILLSICNFYHLINFNFPFTKTFLIVFIKSLQHSIDLDSQDATSNISRDHCQFTFAHLSLIKFLKNRKRHLLSGSLDVRNWLVWTFHLFMVRETLSHSSWLIKQEHFRCTYCLAWWSGWVQLERVLCVARIRISAGLEKLPARLLQG